MRNYNKYKKYVKKSTVISPLKITITMAILFIAMSIGYAAYTDALKVQGTANLRGFTIQYELNGGTNPANPITYYDATMNALLPVPTRTNFNFLGWYDNPSFSGTALTYTPTRKQCP